MSDILWKMTIEKQKDRMKDLLNDHHSKMFCMQGNSMYPNLRDGDIGLLQECNPEDLQTGDIVVFRTNKNFVCHRLINIFQKDGKTVFIARGDKNMFSDPPFLAEDLSGKITCFKRNEKLKSIDKKGISIFLLHFRRILIPCYNLILRFKSYNKVLNDNFKSLVSNIKVIIEKSGKQFLISALIAFLQGVVPFLLIFCIKLLIDSLAGIETGNKSGIPDLNHNIWSTIIPLIALTALMFMLNAIIMVIRSYFSEKLSFSVNCNIMEKLHNKHSKLDLEYYENPVLQDKIHRAVQEAGFRPVKITTELLSLIKSVASVIVMIVLFVSIKWYLLVLIFLAIIPEVYVRLKYSGKRYAMKDSQSTAERKMGYFNRVLTGFPFAKELRLFGFSEFFSRRFLKIEKAIYEEKIKLKFSEMWADIIAHIFAIVLIFLALACVVYLKLTGLISIGSVVLFFFVFQRGYSVLNETFRSITQLYEDNTFLNDFMDLLKLPFKIKPKTSGAFNLNKEILVNDVSFRYSTSERDALTNVSLSIPAGKTVAFVGANGSGKTTMIKLLCGFYSPQNGEIKYDGQKIPEIGEARLRENITAVFQDFALYNVSAIENIALGNVLKEPNEEDVKKAAEAAGIADILEKLPGGYQTMLGHLFKYGEDLSIGQWQKVAIARAFYRDAPILFMDEPSSALDVESEKQLLEGMRKLTKDKTVVIISHRLSTVQWADKIFFFDCGQINESGSHKELMELKGKYYSMFQMNKDY